MRPAVAAGTCLLILVLTSCGGSDAQRPEGSSANEGRPGSAAIPAQAVETAPAAEGSGDSIALPARPGEPCWHAQRRSLEGLAAVADVPVWMPHTARASTETLTGAWTCGADTPFLTFGPVTASYESGYSTPLDWERKAKDTGGYVETILGRPALVDPAEADEPTGEVMVIVDDGVLIRVIGDRDVPAADLVEVANSIDLAVPLAP